MAYICVKWPARSIINVPASSQPLSSAIPAALRAPLSFAIPAALRARTWTESFVLPIHFPSTKFPSS